VPFFILQGENDVLTPPNLAEEFFTDVVAPLKDMAVIRDAGHFAAFMQPEQFLNELLIRVRPLATAPESAGEHAQPLPRIPARRHSLS
jgi:pimeloyl-ACP methyl ester carboxylesterase